MLIKLSLPWLPLLVGHLPDIIPLDEYLNEVHSNRAVLCMVLIQTSYGPASLPYAPQS